MNYLNTFYNNVGEREAIKAFFTAMMREMAADLAIEGKSTGGVKEGMDCINKSFEKLEELYGKIETKEIPNSR